MPITASMYRPSTIADVLLLVARIMIGWIFVRSGYGKILDFANFHASLVRDNVPFAQAVAALAVAVEFLGGAAFMVGFQTRSAALLLALFVLIATLLRHRYWEFVEPAARRIQDISFYKNVAIIGGLFAIAAVGGGRYGVDGFRKR